jgi:cytochrome c-type biogenesis protein CcsB
MLDPTKVAIDHQLVVVVLTAYVVATLAFIGYFLFRTELWRKTGAGLGMLACALQFVELGTRWNMTGVWPLTNLYGSLSLFSALGVLIFLIFASRYDLWLIGGGVLGISAIAFGYATTWNEGYMPAVPALQSYWIKIHVPLVIASYASFMVAFVVSCLYLLKKYAERSFGGGRRVFASAAGPNVNVAVETQGALRSSAGATGLDASSARTETPGITTAAAAGDPLAIWLAGLPTLARLDMMNYRIVAVGLPLLTIGIMTGAMWANEAWGAYWQWDPKETAALVSWIVYAAYMHLHTRNAWRGERSAWVNVFGFATIIFCYLGVNIWISGLHSYKM